MAAFGENGTARSVRWGRLLGDESVVLHGEAELLARVREVYATPATAEVTPKKRPPYLVVVTDDR